MPRADQRAQPIDHFLTDKQSVPYKAWQVGCAFSLLSLLGDKSVPLDNRLFKRADAVGIPLSAS